MNRKDIILKLQKENGDTAETTSTIKERVESFYTEPYKEKTIDTDITTEHLKTINKTDDNVVLTQDFTLTELDKCIKTFKKGKSPEGDGLPLEFYLTFWDILASDLLTVLMDLDRLSRLPDSFRVEIVTLLYKDSDKTDLKN